MTFNSTSQIVGYLDKLISSGVKITLPQLNKLLDNNGVAVAKTLLREGGDEKLVVYAVEEQEEGKVNIELSSPSWLRQLPGVYHDNVFLQNFLFGFQASDLIHRSEIERIHQQFDPSYTQFVDWLCTWVGIRFSSEVDERAKRRVLHNLVRLYKKRGTKAYFIELIEYLSGTRVEIDDAEAGEHLHGSLRRKRRSGTSASFRVYIRQRLSEDKDEEKRKLHIINQILKAEKPMNVDFAVDYPFIKAEEAIEPTQERIMEIHSENSYDYDELRE